MAPLVGPASDRPCGSLLVYDFDLGLSPAASIVHLRGLGFDGVVTGCTRPSDIAKLDAYRQASNAQSGFEVLAYVQYDFAVPFASQLWLDALPILGDLDAPLWIIVKNAPAQADVDGLLLTMAQRAELQGIPVVIYPHWETDIECAAEASALIDRLDHPNLRNSVHTCHEIRAGYQNDLDRVLKRFAGESDFVTVAGADLDAYAGPHLGGVHDWSDAIKPLDRGTMDLTPFLEALERERYTGRVVLHTYGIAGDPGHRQRSHDWYTVRRLGLR